jgi:D-alanyl-lipoteichoic acid acyltransferase DltB (MBOAT superfamily)
MLFNSIEFIYVFLPLSICLHFLAARKSVVAATIVTTISSFVFYAWWKPPFIALPILSIVGNYRLARKILNADAPTSRRLMAVGVTANLLVLGYFKYFDFIQAIFEHRNPTAPDVPLALSFTTFVQIAFLVELSRQRTKVELSKYAMFVSFFPHLIAGPIVRWTELGPQLSDRSRYTINWANVACGLTIFCIGLSKKVLIADKLALHVAPVFDAAAAGNPVVALAAWGASIAYSVQLYFDFSGYSDMAVGIGLLFNMRLPINFAAPFRSTSIIELWRRWHISLSRFLRDFVYIPLGGNTSGPARRSLNLLATMTLGGLWHGANWTFIAWGAFHGALLIFNHGWRSLRGRRQHSAFSATVCCALTFLAFAVGMTMFRAQNIQAAGTLLQAMAGFGTSAENAPLAVPWDLWGIRQGYISEPFVRTWFGSYWTAVGSLTTIGALAVVYLLPDTMEFVDYREGEPLSAWRRPSIFKWQPSAIWAVGAIVVFAITFANLGTFTEFLYYQF